MKSVMMAIGGIPAGLYFLVKEFLPWLEAQRTGAIRAQGYRRQLVRRDEDPERFHGLCRRRLQAAGAGGTLLLGGMVALGLWIAGLMSVSGQ